MEKRVGEVPDGHRAGADRSHPGHVRGERGSRPADAALRLALRRWAFNTKQREHAPGDVVAVLAWVARNTAPVSTLAIPANARRILDAATTSVDGRRAAASTAEGTERSWPMRWTTHANSRSSTWRQILSAH